MVQTIDDVKAHRNYSISDTCRVLDLSVRKLYNLRKSNAVRYYLRKADSEIRIKGTEILKFYNS